MTVVRSESSNEATSQYPQDEARVNLQCSISIGLVEYAVFTAFAIGALAYVRASIEGGLGVILVGTLSWIGLLLGPRVGGDGATLCETLFGNTYVAAPMGLVAGGSAAIVLGLVFRHMRPKG